MKTDIFQFLIALSALGVALGALNKGINPDAIKALERDPDGRMPLFMNDAESKLQSLDVDGTVIDELELTTKQAADLQDKLRVQLEKAEKNQGVLRENVGSALQQRALYCNDWASICDKPADCYLYNCDDCFTAFGRGVCFSYSK